MLLSILVAANPAGSEGQRSAIGINCGNTQSMRKTNKYYGCAVHISVDARTYWLYDSSLVHTIITRWQHLDDRAVPRIPRNKRAYDMADMLPPGEQFCTKAVGMCMPAMNISWCLLWKTLLCTQQESKYCFNLLFKLFCFLNYLLLCL